MTSKPLPASPTEGPDDHLWLEALLGESPAPDSAPAREARLLRMAMAEEEAQLQRDPAMIAYDEPSAREQRVQQLLFRVRGLQVEAPSLHRRSRRAWMTLAAAAVVAAAVMVPLLTRQDPIAYPRPPVWRGLAAGETGKRIQIRIDDPRHAAEALAQLLTTQGVWCAVYQQGERFIVDLDLQQTPSPQLRQRLQDLGVSIGQGVRRVEFSSDGGDAAK